jgi:hypothetical protein
MLLWKKLEFLWQVDLMMNKFFDKLFKMGNAYAVTRGDRIGQLLIYIKSDKNSKFFLAIPKMENVQIPKNVFDSGVNSGIVEFVERIPYDVRRKIENEFEKNSEKL